MNCGIERVQRYTDNDFLNEQERVLSELKLDGSYSGPSVFYQHTVNPILQENVGLIGRNLVDILALTKSINNGIEGKYLLCRTISMPGVTSDRATGIVVVVVEDPEGELAIRLQIDNFYRHILPVGTIMVIQNPLLETSEKFEFVLRRQKIGDLTFLDEFHCQQLFPGITWKGKSPKNDTVIGLNQIPEPKTAEDWKVLGNKVFSEKNYPSAIAAYTSGLRCDPGHLALLSNRSAAYMQLSAFNLALNDVNEVLKIDPHHVKCLYRKAKALRGSRKYKEALEILASMDLVNLEESCREPVIKLKLNVELCLRQQSTGDYDVALMLKLANANIFCQFDYADYVGPVEIQGIPRKGRGLIATQDVSPGQLVIGCKAFAINPYRYNASEMLIEGKEPMELTIARMIMADSEIGKEFYHLYAGPELRFLDHEQGDNTSVVDRKRIVNICTLNYFEGRDDVRETAPGLWLLPSYINHSCIDCNCNWIVFGDFMLIRAIKPIAKGEEVLISYTRPNQLFSDRMEMFKEHMFLCDCRLCEMDQRDSKKVHEKRASLVETFDNMITNKVLWDSAISRRFVDEITSLRTSKPQLNVYVAPFTFTLALTLQKETRYLKSAKVLEKLYNTNKETLVLSNAIVVTVSAIVKAYLLANRKDRAKKWMKKLKQCAALVYGSTSVLNSLVSDEVIPFL